MKTPLEGYRVLDWTIWMQGPIASRILGDLGAEVIKIEPPLTGDQLRGLKAQGIPGTENLYFELINRNKKSITVDITKPEGQEIIYRLIEKSDVFVQNFRKGVAARRGLDYATLRKYNPKLIYATASAWGPNGTDRDRPAFDITGAARSGLMTIGVEPDLPPVRFQDGLCDGIGGIMTAQAIIIALLMREKSGIGQELEVSMLGSLITLLGRQLGFVLLAGQDEPKKPRLLPPNPLWNTYRCKDDKWIVLAHLQSDRHWPYLCNALGLEHLEKDPRFENMVVREKNSAELVAILDKVFGSKTREEILDILKKGGDLIFEPVNNLTDVVQDPQAWANEYFREFQHPTMGKITTVGFPYHFGEASYSLKLPSPEFGQHTEEVLQNILGYSWEKIAEMKDKGII